MLLLIEQIFYLYLSPEEKKTVRLLPYCIWQRYYGGEDLSHGGETTLEGSKVYFDIPETEIHKPQDELAEYLVLTLYVENDEGGN